MMNILYLHQYFITPKQEGGTRSYENAKRFLRNGHQVTIVTSGLMNPEFPVKEGDQYTEYDCEGIRIFSIAAGYNDARAGTGMGGIRRLFQFRAFAKLAIKVGKELGKHDVVFATHTPLHIGLAGSALARRLDVPFVFEVRDLWPDALINIGALKNSLGIAYLRYLERKIYHLADRIVTLSPGMKAGVCAQGISEDKVTVAPNSSDLEMFHPSLNGGHHRARLKFEGKFAAIYFGAMGVANGLDYALDAATTLREKKRDDIVLILHGDGGEKQRLINEAKQRNLKNVIFSAPLPNKKDVAQLVATCDVGMTIYKATKEVSWSPNKLFDTLAAGKPVVINLGDWLGKIVTDNDCGRAVSPNAPHELAEALIEMADSPETIKKMGGNSRKTAETLFARDIIAERIERVLLDAVETRS